MFGIICQCDLLLFSFVSLAVQDQTKGSNWVRDEKLYLSESPAEATISLAEPHLVQPVGDAFTFPPKLLCS